MEDIKVNSVIDFKTYFNVSLLIGLRLRGILILIVAATFISYVAVSYSSFRWWENVMIVFAIFAAYASMILLSMYSSCRRNMKRSAYLTEPLIITLNEEEIEMTGATVSSKSGWKYIIKLVEREKYFLLLTGTRTFQYLPKSGFASAMEITRFKDMVKEKGIKMTYR